MKHFTQKSRSIYLLILLFINVATAFAQTPYKSLNYLYAISGSQTVAGQHNREPNSDPTLWTREIYERTGVYPGLWGGDFLFQADNIANRQTMIDQAITEWNNGALVTLTWHGCSPAVSEPCEWEGGLLNSQLSDAQWNELITNGTYLNSVFKQRMDDIAYYFQQLEDAGVEVLFRPLHEMNQGAFWWGGRPGPNGSARLYQITHDYLTYEKGLSNIIWVWNLQDFGTLASDLDSYDPGRSYWDVLSMDMYYSDGQGYTQSKYDAIVNKAGNKPIAIGEMDHLPSPALLADQPRWAYFMGWAELVFEQNTDEAIQETYWAENVISLNEMPGWDGYDPPPADENIAYMKPVTVSSTESEGLAGPYAVDANSSSRWASTYADNQHIIIDLQASYNINRVVLSWEAAYGSAYQIQVSADNINWATVYETWSGDGGIDDIALSASGRYVKMYGISRATAYGFSLWEFEVYGSPANSFQAATSEKELVFKELDEESLSLAAWPNPFNGQVNIPVHLTEAGPVSLYIYNATGQLQREINFNKLDAGKHYIEWNGESQSGKSLIEGIYLYKVQLPGNLQSGKLMKGK